MDRLLAMEVFCRVVEHGSFVRAAEKMGLSTTAVSRHVSDLEHHLNTRLLQRTTRTLHLTEGGGRYYERCQQILGDLQDAEMELDQDSLQPSGVLRISVSIPFGSRHFAPLIPLFCERFPQVSVEVVATDRKLDLVEDGIDLALRISRELDGSLVARRLADIHTMICAAPSYLERAGTPQTPGDLANHTCLVYTAIQDASDWQFSCPDGNLSQVRVHSAFQADNGDFLLAAAEQGMGITRQPSFMCDEAIAAGRLVPLLTDYHMPSLTLYAVYPSRRFLSAKVRSMVEFLQATWGGGAVPPWDAWRQQGR